jgi:hypothetical protein
LTFLFLFSSIIGFFLFLFLYHQLSPFSLPPSLTFSFLSFSIRERIRGIERKKIGGIKKRGLGELRKKIRGIERERMVELEERGWWG